MPRQLSALRITRRAGLLRRWWFLAAPRLVFTQAVVSLRLSLQTGAWLAANSAIIRNPS
ncbi:MAG: hypothetical protein ACRETC_02465 [Gammaproteobacteria bacterium]